MTSLRSKQISVPLTRNSTAAPPSSEAVAVPPQDLDGHCFALENDGPTEAFHDGGNAPRAG